MKKERMIGHCLILNAIIVTRVIMHEIVLRRTKGHVTTLEAITTCSTIKGENIIKEITSIKDMKVEEDIPQASMKKIVILKRSQNFPRMKVML